MLVSGWTKNILGLRWLLSRTRNGVLPTHHRNFENQQKRGIEKMRNSRCRALCYFALPAVLLAACVLQPSQASAQMTSVGVDCSQINVPSLMMQDNMRAGLILIECGIVQGGHPSAFGGAHSSTTPPNVRRSEE